jgi:hypothetical protein
MNYMNLATRGQRTKLFNHEHDSANKNKLGPGPAGYDINLAEKIRFGYKN